MKHPKFKPGDILFGKGVLHRVIRCEHFDKDSNQYIYAVVDDLGTSWYGAENDFIKDGEKH